MHNSVCSGWYNVWLVQRCAPGTGGTGFEIGSVCTMYCIMFESCFFQVKLYVWKLTMETVVDSSNDNVAFEYMDTGGCGSAAASVVLWKWDGEETLPWLNSVTFYEAIICHFDIPYFHQIVSKMRGPSTTSISRTIASIWHLEGRSANQFFIVDFLGKQKVSFPRKTCGDVKCVRCEERI